MAYEYDDIWVTRWIETDIPIPTQNSLLASMITFGWIPIVLNGLYYLFRGRHGSNEFLVAEFFITLLVSTIPFLIWHWNKQVFPMFFIHVSQVVRDRDELNRIEDKYARLFSKRYLLVSVPWTVAALIAFLGNAGYFADQGIFGLTNIVYWIYVLLFIWSGLITSIGVHIIIITLLCIREVAELPLRLDPLSPDSSGGLSAVGYFAIWTTLPASAGSLALPLAFELAAEGGFKTLIYLVVTVYALGIGLLFLYPTIKINRRAEERRKNILNEYKSKINELERKIGSEESGSVPMQDLACQMEIQRLRQKFEDYQNMDLYPMSLGILYRLISAILLPFIFVFLEVYLPELL